MKHATQYICIECGHAWTRDARSEDDDKCPDCGSFDLDTWSIRATSDEEKAP